MYIGSKNILKKFSNTLPSTINLNTDSISSTDHHKNLGIIFDSNLNFDLHHQNIIKSCYSTLYHLNSLKYNIPTKQKSTLIKSKLHYADLVTFPLNTYWHKKYFKVIKTIVYHSFITNTYLPLTYIITIFSLLIMFLTSTLYVQLTNPRIIFSAHSTSNLILLNLDRMSSNHNTLQEFSMKIKTLKPMLLKPLQPSINSQLISEPSMVSTTFIVLKGQLRNLLLIIVNFLATNFFFLDSIRHHNQ